MTCEGIELMQSLGVRGEAKVYSVSGVSHMQMTPNSSAVIRDPLVVAANWTPRIGARWLRVRQRGGAHK